MKLTVTLIAVLCCAGCQSSKTVAASTTATAPAVSHDDGVIALVRNGMLPGYDSTTVGKALEGTFPNGKWRSFETAKGATIVEYASVIAYGKHRSTWEALNWARMETNYCSATLGLALFDGVVREENVTAFNTCRNTLSDEVQFPVKVQFVISADRKSFEFGYSDMMGDDDGPVKLFDYIYH
jgi:hypothetical protein